LVAVDWCGGRRAAADTAAEDAKLATVHSRAVSFSQRTTADAADGAASIYAVDVDDDREGYRAAMQVELQVDAD